MDFLYQPSQELSRVINYNITSSIQVGRMYFLIFGMKGLISITQYSTRRFPHDSPCKIFFSSSSTLDGRAFNLSAKLSVRFNLEAKSTENGTNRDHKEQCGLLYNKEIYIAHFCVIYILYSSLTYTHGKLGEHEVQSSDFPALLECSPNFPSV